jgi:hypothetical protein
VTSRVRLAVLAIVAVMTTFASEPWADSEQPPPSEQTTQPPTADQRGGTDKIPLTVKILPAPDAEKQAAKAEQDGKEKATIDRKVAFETQRIADYTDRLAWFTLMLFAVAVAQAGLFVWQLGYMKKGMKDATTAARASSRSAKAAVTQAKVARDTLIKTQRPYIFAFGIKAAEFGRNGADVSLKYTVANYGQTPAIIRIVNAGFFEGIEPEVPLQESDDFNLYVLPVLPPSDVRNLRSILPERFIGENFGVIVNIEDGVSYPELKVSGNQQLFFRLIIRYDGPYSQGHETSVVWLYRPHLGHFIQLNAPEYSYQR